MILKMLYAKCKPFCSQSQYDEFIILQKMVILVDKFLKTQVVECATVANWIFSPNMAKDFTWWVIKELRRGWIPTGPFY